ncbi:MAG: glycosyltransferase family 2 protein [Clostridia bacterium]|nr:glycosyltransferase family 2 protein [Clostridia bacterium]
MEPAVSVVMAAYNAEKYIGQAISSVVAQSVKDWELIVIDDCSTDRTPMIIENAAGKDDRIRFYKNEKNIGAARTRNRAFELCRGRYIALLDSDDLWSPDKLEKQIACAMQTGADIVSCSYAMIDEKGDKKCNDFIVPKEIDFDAMLKRSTISCSTALLNRASIEDRKFPTEHYHEDYAYWMLLLMNGAKAVGIPEVLASYRLVEGSRASNKFRSAMNRWHVYRDQLKLSFFHSSRAMIGYMYWGVRKYKRKGDNK